MRLLPPLLAIGACAIATVSAQVRYRPTETGPWRAWSFTATPITRQQRGATAAEVQAFQARLQELGAIVKRAPAESRVSKTITIVVLTCFLVLGAATTAILGRDSVPAANAEMTAPAPKPLAANRAAKADRLVPTEQSHGDSCKTVIVREAVVISIAIATHLIDADHTRKCA